jgi:hypothetical protein
MINCCLRRQFQKTKTFSLTSIDIIVLFAFSECVRVKEKLQKKIKKAPIELWWGEVLLSTIRS